MHNIRKIPQRLGSRIVTKLLRRRLCEAPDLKVAASAIPKGIFGQPTCHTHPHLIAEGHLTCGITPQEFKERRDRLVEKLASEPNHAHKTHIILIPAARKQYMSGKIPFVFRQNSDFFYLTGCLEPSAILVMVKHEPDNFYKTILFVHEKDSHAELWEGPRTGCAAATRLFSVDEARPVENFSNFLHRLTATSKPAVVWYQNEEPPNADLNDVVQYSLKQAHISVDDPQLALHQMRVIKSPAEITLLREACYIGSQSINLAMACTKPGTSEHAISSVLEYAARCGGAQHAAFPPVVGGGARATHIHYVANDQILNAEDMLLVDSGCQRWLYNSDISRTWPVSGTFTKHQRILYELVLTVQGVNNYPPRYARSQLSNGTFQKRLIELLGEQRPALDTLFDHMCRLLGTHLQQEGIFPRNIDQQELVGKAYRLCPHHVSHYLGLDVHDAPLVRRRTPVAPGMLVTVEPGIYIKADDESVPPEFRGLGIRVEDDVLVTDAGVDVLTDSCVKEVRDVEAIVGTQAT